MSGTTWKPLKGTNAGRQYDWINDPPVEVITSLGTLRQIAVQMKTSIEAFDSGKHEEYDDQINLIQEVENWNDRVNNAISILELIIDKTHMSDYALVYKVLGVPAGILCVTGGSTVTVDYLVAHPGVDGAGGTLMELAADWSQAQGQAGRLDLFSYDKKSTAAYKALGFIKSDGDYTSSGTMILTPGTSDVWTFAAGKWRIVKYIAKQYYATRTKPVPPIPVKH